LENAPPPWVNGDCRQRPARAKALIFRLLPLQGEPYASPNTQGAALGLELIGLPGRFYPDNNKTKLHKMNSFESNLKNFQPKAAVSPLR